MSSEPGTPLPSRLRHDAQVVSSRLGDGGVLVHLRTNRIFELNATGYRIWELIGAGHDRTTIAQRLQEEFLVPADRLQRELEDLVAALVAEGLLDDGGGR
jgi:hypothetical protein